MIRKLISLLLVACFLPFQTGFAQNAIQLKISSQLKPAPTVATQARLPHMRYFSYTPETEHFRLLVDKGDMVSLTGEDLARESSTLLKYFLIGVALPNDVFWVNLRPDSADSIIDERLEKTDIGRILLEADVALKKGLAQLTNPQTPTGRAYWDALYKKAHELYGQTQVTIPTLTRPWIVPGEVIIRESEGNAYIYKATLKVLLEQDHLKGSAEYSFEDPRMQQLNEYAAQLCREQILPVLTKQVNTSKEFSSVRQVYYSLILSQWFKTRFSGKQGKYASLIDSGNLSGLTSGEEWSKLTYFKEYEKSFNDGEYNIRENAGSGASQSIRSYVSGGVQFTASAPGVFAGNGAADIAAKMADGQQRVVMAGNAAQGDGVSAEEARVDDIEEPFGGPGGGSVLEFANRSFRMGRDFHKHGGLVSLVEARDLLRVAIEGDEESGVRGYADIEDNESLGETTRAAARRNREKAGALLVQVEQEIARYQAAIQRPAPARAPARIGVSVDDMRMKPDSFDPTLRTLWGLLSEPGGGPGAGSILEGANRSAEAAMRAIVNAQVSEVTARWAREGSGAVTVTADDGEQFTFRYYVAGESEQISGATRTPHVVEVSFRGVRVGFVHFSVDQRPSGRNSAAIWASFDGVNQVGPMVHGPGLFVAGDFSEKYKGLHTTLLGFAARVAQSLGAELLGGVQLDEQEAALFEAAGFSMTDSRETARISLKGAKPASLPAVGITESEEFYAGMPAVLNSLAELARAHSDPAAFESAVPEKFAASGMRLPNDYLGWRKLLQMARAKFRAGELPQLEQYLAEAVAGNEVELLQFAQGPASSTGEGRPAPVALGDPTDAFNAAGLTIAAIRAAAGNAKAINLVGGEARAYEYYGTFTTSSGSWPLQFVVMPAEGGALSMRVSVAMKGSFTFVFEENGAVRIVNASAQQLPNGVSAQEFAQKVVDLLQKPAAQANGRTRQSKRDAGRRAAPVQQAPAASNEPVPADRNAALAQAFTRVGMTAAAVREAVNSADLMNADSADPRYEFIDLETALQVLVTVDKESVRIRTQGLYGGQKYRSDFVIFADGTVKAAEFSPEEALEMTPSDAAAAIFRSLASPRLTPVGKMRVALQNAGVNYSVAAAAKAKAAPLTVGSETTWRLDGRLAKRGASELEITMRDGDERIELAFQYGMYHFRVIAHQDGRLEIPAGEDPYVGGSDDAFVAAVARLLDSGLVGRRRPSVGSTGSEWEPVHNAIVGADLLVMQRADAAEEAAHLIVNAIVSSQEPEFVGEDDLKAAADIMALAALENRQVWGAIADLFAELASPETYNDLVLQLMAIAAGRVGAELQLEEPGAGPGAGTALETPNNLVRQAHAAMRAGTPEALRQAADLLISAVWGDPQGEFRGLQAIASQESMLQEAAKKNMGIALGLLQKIRWGYPEVSMSVDYNSLQAIDSGSAYYKSKWVYATMLLRRGKGANGSHYLFVTNDGWYGKNVEDWLVRIDLGKDFDPALMQEALLMLRGRVLGKSPNEVMHNVMLELQEARMRLQSRQDQGEKVTRDFAFSWIPLASMAAVRAREGFSSSEDVKVPSGDGGFNYRTIELMQAKAGSRGYYLVVHDGRYAYVALELGSNPDLGVVFEFIKAQADKFITRSTDDELVPGQMARTLAQKLTAAFAAGADELGLDDGPAATRENRRRPGVGSTGSQWEPVHSAIVGADMLMRQRADAAEEAARMIVQAMVTSQEPEYIGDADLNAAADILALAAMENRQAWGAISDLFAELGHPETYDDLVSRLQTMATPAPGEVGGIDFRAIPMRINPQGIFQGLQFNFPKLSEADLRGLDLAQEAAQMKEMVKSGILPSPERLKAFVAGCYQKPGGRLFLDEALTSLAEICVIEENAVTESSPELREVLAAADFTR